MLLKLFNRLVGAGVAGARFFLGFRPPLLGIGKHWVAGIRIGRNLDLIQKARQ